MKTFVLYAAGLAVDNIISVVAGGYLAYRFPAVVAKVEGIVAAVLSVFKRKA